MFVAFNGNFEIIDKAKSHLYLSANRKQLIKGTTTESVVTNATTSSSESFKSFIINDINYSLHY